ncbi:MAG: TIGR01440 family protein [Ruminococcus sp.]|nr:TIGR01440 family protein [Ruminococcus sp.]
MYEEIKKQISALFEEVVTESKLKKGDLIVLGCSTSEVIGSRIGTNSQFDCAKAMYDSFYPYLKENGIFLAAQCCEHLGRALVVEREYALSHNLEIVNAIPQPKAGGSSATTAYQMFSDPVLVLRVKADAGVDIGGTLIGMHLREVAVPIKTNIRKVGDANVVCARTRPRFVGGERAVYDESLM